MASGVFINYREVDSRSYAALLYAELSRAFGRDAVFLDCRSIPAGADFVEQLLARVRGCRILLAVIGPGWLAAGGAGDRRIDEARLPAAADLPADLGWLARCQHRRLRHRDHAADLERLRADIAASEPDLGAAAARAAGASPVVPAQLPADVYGFAGRAEQMARLDALLAGAAAEAPTAVLIVAVAGTAGVGKTSLAVHWAHRVAGRFPDGQLYVNLRGFDPGGQIVAPATAMRGFLDALGVPADRVPADLDAQAALYRSLLAGRRMLVVLDNARDADHARMLLPGGPTAAVVVTSRSQLTSLVASDGAHPVTLDPLTDEESGELLARRFGPARLAAEPEAAEAIISACARLPLALALVAGRAATHPTFGLTALAAELSRLSGQVDPFAADDLLAQVRTVFSWSYTALTRPAARLFRLLGPHPGPEISAAAAASLAGVRPAQARGMLAELTCAGLLSEHAPRRYGFHDLLAAYATDLARTVDSDQDRRAATTRLLDHYTHTAHAADRLLNRARDPIQLPLRPPAGGVAPEQPTDDREALAWLTVEHPVLLAAARLAGTAGFDTHAWQLAWALTTFLVRRGHWHDMAGTWQAAVDGTDRLAHPAAAAYAHRSLARAATRLDRYDQAHGHLRRALELLARVGDQAGQADTHLTLGYLRERQNRPGDALGHAGQALTLFRAAGHHRGQVNALNSVGWCHTLLGDHAAALTYCQQALTLHRDEGDRYGEAASWDSLGYAHHHLARYAEATACYQHALGLVRQVGDRYQEATTLTRLGDTHDAAGDPTAAGAAYADALHILTDLDHPDAGTIRAKLTGLGRPRTPTRQPPSSVRRGTDQPALLPPTGAG